VRRYLDGRTMDDVAMERLRCFEPDALKKHENGYWLAFSGGKDSCVILDLAKRAGVKFEAVHNLTTVDPPELVRFVKTFPDVRINKPKESMWQLIRRKGLPPRRSARFCCQELKERGGSGRIIVTGIRAGESHRRSLRRTFEACYRDKTKHYLNPILDWPTDAVWEYIREHQLPVCSLYGEGQKRVGCVLCPMTRDVERQLARWPRLCAAWERAVKATWNPSKEKRYAFASAQEDWEWWLDRDAPSMADSDPVLFEDDPDMTEPLTTATGDATDGE